MHSPQWRDAVVVDHVRERVRLSVETSLAHGQGNVSDKSIVG